MELNRLTLAEGLRAVERRDCTAEEIAEACLRRIEARDGELGAWQWLDDAERVLARVRNVSPTTALRGLIYGAKDTIDTADMPTEYGSALYAGYRPTADAVPIDVLDRAGGVVIGKTVATEFAYFAPGRTVNPHNRERSPGGSSSGSAAAVADHMVPFALGSQTAGSVIRPASYCGCVGYVSSQGGLPTSGVHPLSPSIDALGILARAVSDVQIVRDALLERPSNCSAWAAEPPRVRLLICDGQATGPIEPQMVAAVRAAAGLLEVAGVVVVPLDADDLVSSLTAAHQTIMAFEAARALARVPQDDELTSDSLRALIAAGWAIDIGEYDAAKAVAARAAESFATMFAAADAIIAPAAPGAAPPVAATGSPHASRAWQVLGLPTISLPVADAEDGMPLGVQLIGRRHGDDELLSLADWVLRTIGRSPSTAIVETRARTLRG